MVEHLCWFLGGISGRGVVVGYGVEVLEVRKGRIRGRMRGGISSIMGFGLASGRMKSTTIPESKATKR